MMLHILPTVSLMPRWGRRVTSNLFHNLVQTITNCNNSNDSHLICHLCKLN